MKKMSANRSVALALNELLRVIPALNKVKLTYDDNSQGFGYYHETQEVEFNVLDLGDDDAEFSKNAYRDTLSKIGIGNNLHPVTYALLHELGHHISYNLVDDKTELFLAYRMSVRYLQHNEFDNYEMMLKYFFIPAELDANIYAMLLIKAYEKQIEQLDRDIRFIMRNVNLFGAIENYA